MLHSSSVQVIILPNNRKGHQNNMQLKKVNHETYACNQIVIQYGRREWSKYVLQK